MRRISLVLTLLALLAVSCGRAPSSPGRAPHGGAPVDLTFRALDGGELSLESLRGKVVVVDAWATWCGPCIQALPSMERLARSRPDEIVVVGLSVDHDKKALADFVAERPLPYFVAHADALAARTFRTQALPTVFILDREGIIRETLIGTHPDAVLIETAKRYL